MKRTFTLVLMSLVLGLGQMLAAFTQPEAGKVYRIYNAKVKDDAPKRVIGEDPIARQVSSDVVEEDNLKQLWVLSTKDSGYLLQNAYSGQYLHPCQNQSTQVYPTGAEEKVMYITQVNGTKYAIGQAKGAYLHLDGSNNIVRWYDDKNESSQWQFEEVNVSAETISLSQAAFKTLYEEYQAKLELITHVDEYNALLPTFFADVACTELNPAYAGMSDEELRAEMSALPTPLQDMAIKIKNQQWGHREQEFRIRNYKAYSDADYWGEKLYTKKYSRINNPTGVYGKAGDVLYVFVGNDIPKGTTLQAEVICGSAIQGTAYDLKKGLNMIPTVKDYSNIFVQYVGETSLESDVLITDYPELKVHIEEGVVNGFWNIDEHDDEDWVDMMTNLATADVFQVKGERIMFHMSKYYMKKFCSQTITDAIGWWDDMTRWQQDMLGIEDVRLKKFNNLGCAISLTTGYQSATHYRTQYLDSYIGNLLPYENMMSNADNCWGPAHENGHVHQAAIQSVGTAEVSNNFFSNLTLDKLGRYTSRGSANDVIFSNYGNHIPYILRDGATTMRSFWQLYLYFHKVKGDETFYPRVFQAMRATPMKARDPKYYANSVYGNEDLLIFAKACCDVAQMDLSEFFRFWGYLEITDNQHIGDYGDFYLTTRESDVEEFLAHASQYPKAPSIIFIEDRVKNELRTDGGDGYKQHHGNAVRVGEAGDVGHYTDYMDTSVKAEGYVYRKKGMSITIGEGSGAVGFKVYDKTDNTLLYGSNRLKFNIPKEYEKYDVVVVASQADGTDVVLKSLAEGGTEEQQLALLLESLDAAKEYAERTDETGTRIGYLKSEYVVELNELISKVESVIQNSDQSEKTYGAWSIQLDAIVSSLYRNLDARVSMVPDCFYSITLSSDSKRYLYSVNSGLVTETFKEEEVSYDMQWRFVDSGIEGAFYIQHRETGNYVSTIASNGRVRITSKDIAEALPFCLIADAPGEYYIQSFEDPDVRIYNNSSNQGCAGNQNGDNAKWVIRLEDEMFSMPEVSSDEQLVIYYIQRTDNNKFINKYSGRDGSGRVSSDFFKDHNDYAYWFYFCQGSEEGKYKIYNYNVDEGKRYPVTLKDGALYVNVQAEVAPEFTIAFDESGTALTIAGEEGFWGMEQSSATRNEFVVLKAEADIAWRVQHVRTISLVNEPLESITISQEKVEIVEGESFTLTVTETAPVFATNHSVVWSSNNPDIATVDADGKVVAIKEGVVLIKATACDGSGVEATCQVSVQSKLLKTLSVNKTSATISEGDSITLTVKTMPSYAVDHSVTWSSDNTDVATVDADGKVKAIAEGTAIITVTANDGSGLSATCKVTVKKKDTGVVTEEAVVFSVQGRGGVIIVDGLAEGTVVSVYNLVGSLIATGNATIGTVSVKTGLDKGDIAIVAAGEHCVKVQMR